MTDFSELSSLNPSACNAPKSALNMSKTRQFTLLVKGCKTINRLKRSKVAIY